MYCIATWHTKHSFHLTAAFSVSLELQGDCSDQLTLICRHADTLFDPTWIHNGTAEDGQLLTTAFPGLTMYSFQNSTEHRVTVTEVDDVAALDGYVFQCVYGIQGTLIKSNTVKYSFVPNGQSQQVTYLICLALPARNCIMLYCTVMLIHKIFLAARV